MAEHGLRAAATGARRVTYADRLPPLERVAVNVVYFIFTVIVLLLAFRFVLLLFGANVDAMFAKAVYAWTTPLMAPFQAVFVSSKVARSTFEWSALLAMAVYALVAWGIGALAEALTLPALTDSAEASVKVLDRREESRADRIDKR